MRGCGVECTCSKQLGCNTAAARLLRTQGGSSRAGAAVRMCSLCTVSLGQGHLRM
jgi:hypothetical protein